MNSQCAREWLRRAWKYGAVAFVSRESRSDAVEVGWVGRGSFTSYGRGRIGWDGSLRCVCVCNCGRRPEERRGYAYRDVRGCDMVERGK